MPVISNSRSRVSGCAAAASFTYQNTAVCFFGHTHVPVAFMRDSMVRGGTYSKFKTEPGKKYLPLKPSLLEPAMSIIERSRLSFHRVD